MLKENLASILGQTFSDYEVMVGNDFPAESISTKCLGMPDPRIRVVNHPKHVGELNNMNGLLEMSQGRYFTWLADDDMYAPRFLESGHAALVQHQFPPYVITSYSKGAKFAVQPEFVPGRVENYCN